MDHRAKLQKIFILIQLMTLRLVCVVKLLPWHVLPQTLLRQQLSMTLFTSTGALATISLTEYCSLSLVCTSLSQFPTSIFSLSYNDEVVGFKRHEQLLKLLQPEHEGKVLAWCGRLNLTVTVLHCFLNNQEKLENKRIILFQSKRKKHYDEMENFTRFTHRLKLA
ncbi:CLUMA_CG011660, isoform A [Clunio marinus]|uniref:CLUMA_CG011660, isoform A n=1 Tax=Clunio marinus TaxID=568069 RepID=A0A1J1IEV7_9DIPT|nr:CLUMA_CG011660, isoform A [Clunio marinus]